MNEFTSILQAAGFARADYQELDFQLQQHLPPPPRPIELRLSKKDREELGIAPPRRPQ